MNYNPSTIGRIGDIYLGLRTDTSTVLGTTWAAADTTQYEWFNVVGRVLLIQLFLEVVVAAAGASTPKFNATFTTPVIAVADISAACGSIDTFAAGRRISWVGTTVATAAATTQAAGISYHPNTIPFVIGGIGFVGTIGTLNAAAAQTSGSMKASAFWVPMYEGSYIAAAV